MKIKLQAPMSCSGSFGFRVLSLEFKVLRFRGLGFWGWEFRLLGLKPQTQHPKP